MDRRYLRRIAEHHNGGPVGVETLAAALAEARDTLEDVIEPYLIQEGLILRTPRGRMLGLARLDPSGPQPARRPGDPARPAGRAASREADRPTPRACGTAAGLFRGHRRRRHGLPRELPALGRTRPDGNPCGHGLAASDAHGRSRFDARGAAHRSGVLARRPGSTTRSWSGPRVIAVRGVTIVLDQRMCPATSAQGRWRRCGWNRLHRPPRAAAEADTGALALRARRPAARAVGGRSSRLDVRPIGDRPRDRME